MMDVLCSTRCFHHDYSIEDERAYNRTAVDEALDQISRCVWFTTLAFPVGKVR